MKQTLLVKLAPTPDQHAALLRTLEAFHAACTRIAAVACAEQNANKLQLQQLVYYDVRRDFDLSAQMALRAIAKVSEAYKRDRKVQPEGATGRCDRKVQPSFWSHGAMTYDQRIC